MTAYKEPGIEARRAAATQARAKALAGLKAKPPVDPAVLAERLAKARAREQAQAEKREAVRASREVARAAKAEKAEAFASASELTEADRKAARDARYAARKGRKK